MSIHHPPESSKTSINGTVQSARLRAAVSEVLEENLELRSERLITVIICKQFRNDGCVSSSDDDNDAGEKYRKFPKFAFKDEKIIIVIAMPHIAISPHHQMDME